MDDQGRLIITDEKGDEKFRGKTIAELQPEGYNRKQRRRQEAIDRKMNEIQAKLASRV